MSQLLGLSASEMARLVRTKKCSPRELIDAHIAQIEKVNPKLNAVCEDLFDSARSTADEQTQKLTQTSSAELPVFFGVPMTVKEMLALKGCKRTGGSIHQTSQRMQWTATANQTLLDAGAIPLATTNVPELGFWFETHNPVYGRTSNPYDFSRTCGGSSGGEGALIGAGASPMGTGSDIGGSIRMPAFFCGVFGHKPTWKSVPLTGHFPYEKQDIQSNLRGHRYPLTSVGPLARSAEDLIAMMKLFNQADEIDQEAKLSIEWQTLKKIKGLKVFILPSPKIDKATRTDIELQDVVIKAAQSLKEQGAEIEELSERFFAEAAEVWFALVKSISQRPYHVLLQGPEEIKILREMWNIARGKPRYTLPSLVVSLREKLPLPDSDLAPALAKLSQMRADLVRHLGDNGVLLMPTHPRVAPVHRAPLYRPFDFVYTGIFNALGVPATAVPMGLNKEGLPLGLQVIAKHRRDDLTLFIAQHLETEFGGWKPSRAIY